MATKDDIEHDLTLELDGHVSPSQLAKALTAFSALLTSGHKKIEPDKAIQWGVQVKKGSNLVGVYPQQGAFNPALIDNLRYGIKQLDEGVERPTGFDEGMLHNLKTLCEVSSDTKRRKTSVGLWLGKEKTNITMTVKSHVNIVLEGEFEEYGAIEGKLETLDAHDKYQFAIYEPLHLKKIVCTVDNDEVFTRAYELFEQRVEAEGYIKYTATGIPYEITVDRFNPIPEIMEKHSYKSTRGILKEYV